MANNTEKRITAKMILDSSGYNEKLKGINAEMKKHQSQVKLASEGLKTFGKDNEKLKSVQESLTKQLDLHTKKVNLYESAIEKSKKKLEDNIKVRDKNKTALEKANKAYDEAVKMYGKGSDQAKKAENEIKKLTDEHKKSEKALESNAKQIQTYETNLNKAKEQMTKTEGELQKVNKELDNSKNKWMQQSEKLKESSEKLKNVGESTQKVGEGMMKAGAGAVGFGVAATKANMDFSDSLAKVSTIADTTKVPLGDLKKGVLDLSKKTGMAANELNEGLYQAISASVDTASAVDFLGTAVKAAKGGFTDTATAVDGLTTVLNSYGMEANKADKIANQMLITQNEGKTSFGELASAVGKVTPIAANLGVTTEELFSSLASTTAQGLATSESVTALKAAMSNIIKPSKDASDAAELLGIEFNASALKSKGWKNFLLEIKDAMENSDPMMKQLSETMDKNAEKMMKLSKAGKENTSEFRKLYKIQCELREDMLSLGEAQDSPLSGFAKMFGSVEGLNSILMLTSENGMAKYNKSMEQMKTNTTALDDAFNKMNTTPGAKMRKSLNELKIKLIEVGDNLSPVIDSGTRLLGLLSKIDPKILANVVRIGGLTFALGGLTKGIGGTISAAGEIHGLLGKIASKAATTGGAVEGTSKGFGILMKTSGLSTKGLGLLTKAFSPLGLTIAGVSAGIYLYNKNQKVMGESCLKASDDMGFLDKSFAKLNGSVVLSKDEMGKAGVKYKEFSKTVSQDTAKSIKECSNRIAEFNMKLEAGANIKDFIKTEDGQQLLKNLDEIYESAKKKIESRNPEISKKLSEAFKADDGVIDAQEQELLNQLDKTGGEQLKKLDDNHKKILELIKKSGQQQGEEKRKTIAEIEKLTKEIGDVELNATAKSQQELLDAKATFQVRMEKMDMIETGKLLGREGKKTREQLKIVKKGYDDKIEALKIASINMDDKHKKIAEKEIQQMEQSKKDAVQKEKDKFQELLKLAVTKYPEIAKFINIEDGKELTRKEQTKQENLRIYGEKMEGLFGITSTGWYKIRNNQDQKLHEIYVDVDEATGDIRGVWDKTVQGVYGNPIKTREEIAEEMKNGLIYKPISDNWNSTKQTIWKEPLELQKPIVPANMFGEVEEQYRKAMGRMGLNPSFSVKDPSSWGVSRKWTGDNYFKGGLTYLHDAPGRNSNYELYNLPRGSKIYNHDASEELVTKTAENVATRVANAVLKNFKGSNGVHVENNFYEKVESPYETSKAIKKTFKDLRLA